MCDAHTDRYECDQMKTLNIVQTQNYDLYYWKMSTDHKKSINKKISIEFQR